MTQCLRARRQPEWALYVVAGGGWPNAACRNRSVVRRVSAHGGDLVSTSGAGAGEEGVLIRMAQPGVSEVEKRGESVPGAQYKDGIDVWGCWSPGGRGVRRG